MTTCDLQHAAATDRLHQVEQAARGRIVEVVGPAGRVEVGDLVVTRNTGLAVTPTTRHVPDPTRATTTVEAPFVERGIHTRLGFDPQTWQPAPGQEADYAASLTAGFGHGDDLRAHLAHLLSPRRTVTVPTVLMAVTDESLTELPGDMPAVLAGRGLRMPTPDEWEHACGAGADTLFRWGGECPLDRIPYGPDGPHEQRNAFGLRIAYDTYRAELSTDTTAVHGGDGGESVCGGYGHLLAWLPLATANRNPNMAEFVYGPEGEDLCEDFSTRPVLTL
ncbi:hypothetical protein ACWDA3_14530 [Nonomuraea rubra]